MLGRHNPKIVLVAGAISYILITFGGSTAKTIGFGIASFYSIINK